tara:strand:- start:1012 stop:2274 length:1263 start_codon:yes stop_codon:yes gene_type:complete
MSETKTNPEVTQEVKSEGGDMKMKSKPKIKKFESSKNEPFKVDLSKVDTSLEANAKVEAPIKVDLTKSETKKEDDAIQIGDTKEIPVGERTGDSKGVDGEVRVSDTEKDVQVQESESPIEEIQEIDEGTLPKENIVVDETSPPTYDLPENVEKLVDFMKETGGDVEDYVRLNADYSKTDEDTLLNEYYKKTKPHLNTEEISFIMEENFSYDGEVDEERDIRRKKLAKKEEIAKAKNFLEDLKVKYYDEIKLRPGVTQEQRKATDFFNRYNDEQELAQQKHGRFLNDTKTLFNEEFKGFDFEVGEKKFRYGVKDPTAVAENQSNLNNFVGKFLDKEGNVTDTKGYHKAMYAAQNVDKIINHFYEQGKTDGIKTVMEGSKNPTLDSPRQTAGDGVFVGGFKVRSIDGVDSSKLKIKKSKFNN